jgi:hypothetical protein
MVARAMTNADRVIAALQEHGPLSDSELVRITGIRPHQQINQLCHRLETHGMLRRVQHVGGPIVNVLVAGGDPPHAAATPPLTRRSEYQRPEPPSLASSRSPVVADRAVLVLPCSARKQRGGSRDLRGATVLDLLPLNLADQLAQARQRLRLAAAVDDSLLLPAWKRYDGTFYQAAGDSIGSAIASGVTILIISGGYGLVLGQEPIGFYERRLSLADWPRGMLADCLEAVVASVDASRVLAFCARSTAYAQLVREVPWSAKGVDGRLVSPELLGRGGAQVLVPRALGESFRAAAAEELTSPWRSGDGVAVMAERLR